MNYQLQPRQVRIAIDAAHGIYETQTRFDICDATGKVIDDAQGYGYKTEQSAHKAAAYKFKGGQKKADDAKAAFLVSGTTARISAAVSLNTMAESALKVSFSLRDTMWHHLCTRVSSAIWSAHG